MTSWPPTAWWTDSGSIQDPNPQDACHVAAAWQASFRTSAPPKTIHSCESEVITMRLGTMTSLFFTRRGREDRISYLESVRRCHDAGFRVLDANLCPLSRRQTTLHLDDWRQQVDEIRNEAEKLGMVFSQSHPPYRGRLDRLETEEDRQYFRSMLLRAIEISAMLGVKWAVLHPETAPGSSCYDLEANIRENQRIYDQELELAHKLGVGLAFENMCDRGQRRRFGTTAYELEKLMDACASPLVGICWDVGHAHRTSEDQIPGIMRLGNRIKALHIDDNHGEKDLHLMPFLGSVPWEDVMHALYVSGCQADLIYEIRINGNMPDELMDLSARYCRQVGEHLLSLYR